MLDIKYIRENFGTVEEGIKNKGYEIDLKRLLSLDNERKKLKTEIDSLRERRNKLSKNPLITETEKKEAEKIKDEIKTKEKTLTTIETEINDLILKIPNVPDPSVPVGKDETENKVIFEEEPKKFDFEVKPHWEIGEILGILDFERASKISTSRFAIIKNLGAKLERALINFMLEVHTKENNYTEIFAPFLVNRNSMTGTGQLPRFEIEMYKCRDDELFLIPTAEVSVTNIHRDEIIDEDKLPLKYVSYSACFRREAGSYGKDTKGLIRNHQFNKIELVKFTKPEDSDKEFELLVEDATKILKKLDLKYRVVSVCSGDLSFASKKTYDLEVYMPGEKRWRELSSCSNFGDFQARRINVKLKRKNGKKEFVHTINGSGLAIGRTFAAIIENYQTKDGSIIIPEPLREYIGVDKIG